MTLDLGAHGGLVERVDLLHPRDGDVGAGLVAAREQVVVDLARAQHEAARAVAVGRDHGAVGAVGEVGEGADGFGMAEQALRRHHDQRLLDAAHRLAAEGVEVVGRLGEVGDDEVVLGRELQKALHARRRVLRPLALEAVRQQHHQARRVAPLGLGGGDKLVDHDLGAVDEVAELRLPEHERVGVAERVAVLEAERGVLGEERVVDGEVGLRLAAFAAALEMVERDVDLAVLLVVQHRVALAEGAALAVLAA